MKQPPTLLKWQQLGLSVPEEFDLLLSGGRGGGKTTFLVYLIIRDALRFGRSFVGALVRKDLAGLKKLEADIFALMDRTPELHGSKYLSSVKEFRFNTGAVLYLHWISDERSFSRFQGLDLSHLYVDEAAQLAEPESLLRFRSSLRSKDPNVKPRTVLTANPNNAGSWWIADNIITGAIPWQPRFVELFRKNVVYINSTLFDNPYITDRDSYIETLKASCNFDEAKIRSEVYGEWTTVSGSFFGHVLSESRSKVPWLPLTRMRGDINESNFYMSLDWGTRSPASLILAFRAPHKMAWGTRIIGANSIVLLDEYYSCLKDSRGKCNWHLGDRTLTTRKMAHEARQLAARNHLNLDKIPRWNRVADSAITANTGSDEGSICDQLTSFGSAFRGVKGRRADGWQVVATLLEAAGDPEASGLYVTERVPSFWKTFPGLVYDDKNPEDIDTSGIDHTADSTRYLCVAIRDESRVRVGARFR